MKKTFLITVFFLILSQIGISKNSCINTLTQYSNEFWVNISGTIIGGLFLTFILFVLNEYVFEQANLSGEWRAIIKIESTSYRSFQDLEVEYKIHLIQKGYELSGSGEKIKDINPDGTQLYFERKKRVIIDIEGYFERKYIAKSKIYLNISEEGRERESRATYFLTFNNHTNLQGTFISTAADARGSIKMIKS